jgi:hypothetical protein
MQYHMDKTLRFWVEHEAESTKRKFPNLSQSQLIASILCEFESAGHANRFVRKDGKIGWRATDKMREDLFEQEQAALDNDDDD